MNNFMHKRYTKFIKLKAILIIRLLQSLGHNNCKNVFSSSLKFNKKVETNISILYPISYLEPVYFDWGISNKTLLLKAIEKRQREFLQEVNSKLKTKTGFKYYTLVENFKNKFENNNNNEK
jgi:hypothetical protein